jgi:long-chain acyl-CoA synthetase
MEHLAFWDWAQSQPDRVALIYGDEARTAGELLDRVNRLTNALRAQGLGRGDVVAMVVRNEPVAIELFMAVAQAGMFLVPINWHLATPEIAYILEDSGAKVVVCSPEHSEQVTEASAEGVAIFESTTTYETLLSESDGATPQDRLAGTVMNYTSGTTGRPKGVRRPMPAISPEVIATSYAGFLRLFGMAPNEGVHLVSSPLYHTAVLNFATSSLHLGHSVVVMRKWTPETCLDAIARHRVTQSHMVPTQFVRLLALPDDVRAAADVSSCRHMVHSAAPCPIAVKHAMLKWWGPCILEYYAATEGGGTVVRADEWLKRPGTVGQAWPGSEVVVLDDDQVALPPNEVGTVYMRMGQHTFEYHGDEEKTKRAFIEEGFFTVGDAGYLDAEGYLYLCDRKADMIISGGVNIYPAEIEAVLIGHDKVADVAVFGIPDAEWGEQVKAVVEPPKGVDVTADELLGWARGQLAKYKCPKSIDFVEALPRDDNGKLYKRKLRDPYWAETGRSI